MKQITLMTFLLMLACEDNRYERLALEESRRSSKLGESILVDFSGSSIVKIRSSSANEQDVARAIYTVSESLGADVTVQSSDCEPVILDFIITQLNADALECNFQTERLASKAWLLSKYVYRNRIWLSSTARITDDSAFTTKLHC